MRKNIKILNPLDGPGWTSRQRAKRYVARGAAEWVKFGVSLKFLRAENHREVSVRRSVADDGYDRAANIGMARRQELIHLPLGLTRGNFLQNFFVASPTVT